MARRRQLNCVASGILGSFNSRNNDVDGYWGLGKLYRFVQHTAEKQVALELMNKTIAPFTNEFDELLAFYRSMLSNQLRSQKIPETWVVSVRIGVVFESRYINEQHLWRSGVGKPCIMQCRVTDDLGRDHIADAYNNCLPHDPSKEGCRRRIQDR